MATIIVVSIEIETVVLAAESDGSRLADQIRGGLAQGACDADLVLWLLEGAVIRCRVST